MKRVALFILLLLTFLGCKSEHPEHLPSGKKIKAPTLTVFSYLVNDYVIVPGRTKATQSITLASKTMGTVKNVLVSEGQRVKKGQLLIMVDDAEIIRKIKALKEAAKSVEKQIKAQQAQLEYARLNYLRYKKLLKEEAATKEEFDRAKSLYLSAKNQMEALKFKKRQVIQNMKAMQSLLKYTRIKAPASGVITAKLVDKGTFISPGRPLIKMDASTAEYEFIAEVDAKYMPQIKVGRKLPVLVEGIKIPIFGRVKSVSPAVNPSSNTFLVRLSVKHNKLHSGMFGRLLVPVRKRKTILIPQKVLLQRGNLKAVYTVDKNGTVHFQIVRAGFPFLKTSFGWVPADIFAQTDKSNLWIEILSGLNQGETIVAGKLNLVREGDTLER